MPTSGTIPTFLMIFYAQHLLPFDTVYQDLGIAEKLA